MERSFALADLTQDLEEDSEQRSEAAQATEHGDGGGKAPAAHEPAGP